MDDLRRALLQLILDNPEIKSEAIYEHPSLQHEENKRVSNFLYLVKQAGQAVADAGRHYTVTAKGRAYLNKNKGEDDEPAPTKAPRRSSPPLARPRDGAKGSAVEKFYVEEILVEAEANAQSALDRYLTSVGDQNIIGPLRASRDAAREALKNYRHENHPSSK